MRNLFSFLIITSLVTHVIAIKNPYETLGVKRDASLEQIKKAYRDLAKKYHPDTSSLGKEDASKRFIELNKAFDILKDQSKRKRFDKFGDLEEDQHGLNHNGFNTHRDGARETWFHSGFGNFQFYAKESQFRKRSATAHKYHSHYVNESKNKPFLIFFYTDFCPSCSMIEETWFKVTDELVKFNVGSFTLNVRLEPQLSKELGANSIPHIACLIDGHIVPYYRSELSLTSIVRFIKESLPQDLVPLLNNEKEQERFLGIGSSQNKLSAIVYHKHNIVPLRYLIMAYESRNYYRFGQISTVHSSHKTFSSRYRVANENQSRQTNLLVFDEDLSKARINIALDADSFDYARLRKILFEWPFLSLPRLSSQQMFDDLCIHEIPKDMAKTQRRLCVILFTTDTQSTKAVRNKLIEFINLNNLQRDNGVVFAYIDTSKQVDFIKALLSETVQTYPFKSEEPIDSSIILIERHPQDYRKAVHRWITKRWNLNDLNKIDEAKHELRGLITDYKMNSLRWQDKVALTTLFQEDGLGFMERIARRVREYLTRIASYVVSSESFFTLVMLTACAIITSAFIYYSPVMPSYGAEFQEPTFDESISWAKESSGANSSSNRATQIAPSDDELKIMELKAETYFGMIRLIKPGCRSIIILVDQGTKDKLLPIFKKAVWPYRRNKTLLFGYLCLDKNLEWYKSLLKEVLDVEELNVNKKNCIGTVLSLNGFKKYFRVYHSKHHEIDSYDDDTDPDGSFLGFNEDDVEAQPVTVDQIRDSNSYSVESLLDRFPIWLDKTFDGLTRRYFIDEWPSEMK